MKHISVSKWLPLILCIGSVFLLSGCAFKDIDKRLFVSAIGIDPAENAEKGYKVTLKVALPFGAIKESTKPSYAYLSREGDSVGEALRMLETHADKLLELGHMKTIVVHEDLLTEQMKDFMNYFIRRGDIQLIAYVAAARPSAETILKVEPATEAPASVALFNYFGNTANESPFVVTTYLFQLRRDALTDGISPVLPLIETNEMRDELIVNNSLVADDREKPVELTTIETKYYNTLMKGATGFTYKVKDGDFEMLLNVSQTKMTYNFKPADGKKAPRSIDMHVKLKGTIAESKQTIYLTQLEKYNQLASKEIKQKVLSLLTRMQEENLDPFGFGLHYRATRLHEKDVFTTWETAYPGIKFNIAVDVKLQGSGTLE